MMARRSKNGVRSIHIHDGAVIKYVERIASELNCSLYVAVEKIIKDKIKKEINAPIAVFEYGDKVRDMLTGYEGRITAMCSYYGTKPDQYLVESIDSTGRPCDYWIEEERLEEFKESEDE